MILRTNNNRGPMYYCPYIYCLMMYKFLFYFFRLLFSTIDRKYEFLCCSKTLFIPKHLGFPSKLLISVYLIWLAYFLFLFCCCCCRCYCRMEACQFLMIRWNICCSNSHHHHHHQNRIDVFLDHSTRTIDLKQLSRINDA